jgi:hypothetical protein
MKNPEKEDAYKTDLIDLTQGDFFTRRGRDLA